MPKVMSSASVTLALCSMTGSKAACKSDSNAATFTLVSMMCGFLSVRETIEAVRKINPDIMVLQGAGISGPDDVANVIRAGAQATGCTSGVFKAKDPEAAAEEMLWALRKTWDEVHGK